MQLDNSTAAIVTGAASGLGEGVVRALAAEGVKVSLFDLNEARAAEIAAEVGGTACCVDVTEQASVEAGFAKARGANGQERLFVNCAGVAPNERIIRKDKMTGALEPHLMSVFQFAVEVNLTATFRCASVAAAGMAALEPVTADGERGVIINTASISAEDGQERGVAYAASKAGVVGLGFAMARALRTYGIRVNTISPGLMNTALMSGVPWDYVEKVASTVPFPSRLGQPAEFAELVLFLARNGYMNGETIRLDAAMRLPPS